MLHIEDKKQLTSTWFRTLQDSLISTLEILEKKAINPLYTKEPGQFIKRSWNREGGGGGTMAFLEGRVFEKAVVNFSEVYGEFSDEFRSHIPGTDKNPSFWASGISVILHPKSPLVPIVHMNTRFIVTEKHWFGGGADLTPCIIFPEDTDSFHTAFKNMCDKYDSTYYPTFKKAADAYFYLPHRNEARGVGGIFYDYLNQDKWEDEFLFTKDVGTTFQTIYSMLVERHMNMSWTDNDYKKQLTKRSRYVEFNLLYDRGTQFGLKTNGNIEAILMSLPPLAAWTIDQS